MKKLLIGLILLNTTLSYAAKQIEVICEEDEYIYSLLIDQDNNKSSLYNSKLIFSPKFVDLGLEKFIIDSVIIDDELECIVASKSPVIVKCKSNREYEISVPKAGITNKRKNIIATFEIMEKELKERSIDGVSVEKWSYMSYSLSNENLGMGHTKPITIIGRNNNDNFEQKIHLDIRSLELSGQCTLKSSR